MRSVRLHEDSMKLAALNFDPGISVIKTWKAE